MKTAQRVFALFIVLIMFNSSKAQESESFDARKVVETLADIMNKNYVYPEKGESMSKLVLDRLKNGDYDRFSDAKALAAELQRDLRSVTQDKHIRVISDASRVEAMRNRTPGGGRKPPKNFGFEEVKTLEQNIGYLDLRGFMDISVARAAAKEAMDELIKSDAIIFDLRRNGGGSPSMIRFISSYIFGDEAVHLNDFYWRPTDQFSESWTDPKDASQNKPDIPVYVLTSNYTFSAAEEFTYNLKNLKRATIIGETTGGGAHPGGPMIVDDQFIVNVPQGRAISPITKTNWEGVGVVPHIKVSKEEALDKALELAKRALSEK